MDTSTNRESITAYSDVKLTEFTSDEVEVLGFNCSNALLSNVNLRRAIACMIDYGDIRGSVYYNSGILNDDLYFPGYMGTEIKQSYTTDVERARQFLTDGGYEDIDADGVLESSDGKNLSFTISVASGSNQRILAAENIASTIRNYGITVSVREVNAENFAGTISSGNYDMFVGSWKIGENYDLRDFYYSGRSYAKYSNPTLDPLLDIMQSAVSEEERLEALNSAKNIIAEDMPYICLLYKTYVMLNSADLMGEITPRFNDYYSGCSTWTIRRPKTNTSEQ